MSHHLDLSSGAAGRVTLRNPRVEPLPIEVRAVRRSISEDGTSSFTPADADFLIFPPQALVPAGGAQAFQFQYVGPTALDRTAAYVLYLSEVPVSQAGGITVQIIFELGVAVYLHPQGARADLRLEGVRPLADGSAEVMVRNHGGRLVVLGPQGLNEVAGAAGGLSAYGAAATRNFGSPIIPAYSLRRFLINRPVQPGESAPLEEGL
ncbi:fimbria/pilus periplasmic chaperone [Neomegalonema sp.]|uniref:fimbria/pilus periplasmic chaperone n=1 Tax=Neomegalonema sp. TaxID=2039713 RepID=UPI002628DA95|nr:fimbria/pilus periplasmic chaperone [Neomegalonema sp.]MDD2869834.1 molecular chaperone [Neomegalonema sp.]